ncbi:MAG: DUF5668 domain-containing protein [Bacteroidales bacterium]|nr:DUF5668 domain-containing protein [Bacteroidales bacterium]
MSYRKIFWGILLVIIGILFILKNTGVLFFSWSTMWHLWPVILILWGISLIPVKDWIKLVLSLLTVVITFFAMQQYGPKDNHNWNWEWNDNNNRDNDDEDSTTVYNNVMSEDFDSLTKFAELKLNIGVGNFTIKDTTNLLIEVKHDNDNANYSMTAKEEDSLTRIDLSLEKGEFNNGNVRNNVNMKLNPNPIWDLDLNVGAAEVNFDLSGFKTRNLKIQGGASDIDLKIGAAVPLTDVKLEAGAASIMIRVPESAGCEIISNTFMSSKDFKGFTKIGKQKYQTPNFATSTNKIMIDLQAGVARVDVVRY